jgi:hypothetical protein
MADNRIFPTGLEGGMDAIEHERDVSTGAYRGPGFVVYDDKGYDLELALASVGKGWADIIKRLWEHKTDAIKVVQVKEKFAGLRVYTSNSTPEFEAMIEKAEEESFQTCEVCGAPGCVRAGGWILTLCETHAEGRKPIDSGN